MHTAAQAKNTIRALVLREGRPAVVESIDPTEDGFATLVGGDPFVVPLTDDYLLLLCREAAATARPNIRLIDSGDPGTGLVAGTVVVMRASEGGSLISLSDAEITALRGALEGRRVGSC